MNLSEILEGKKVTDFSREELIELANVNEISFKENSKETTIFNKLVKLSKQVEEVEVRILEPVAGKYLLSHNVGEVVSMDANQAAVLVENKDAEFVK